MKYPRLLKKGDKIAVVAPSGKVSHGDLDRAREVLSSWGLNVVLGDHVYSKHHNFAGKDEDRLTDLQWALDDPSIIAVLCARGGYGLTRIIDRLELTKFKAVPKWVVGYSDITALLLQFNAIGIASIHGPMATSFNQKNSELSIDALGAMLFEGVSHLRSSKFLRNADFTAEVTGGNLSLIIDSLGTANEIETKGKILFIEEVGEKTYRIDRMFQQLKRAGILTDLAGLIIGHFSKITDEDNPFGQTWDEVISNLIRSYKYPVGFGFPIGHEPENLPIIVGGSYHLKAKTNSLSLSWKHPGLK